MTTKKTAAPKKANTATKTEKAPKPREQRLVMGDVDGNRMEWVFAENGRVDFLDVNDGDGYHHFSLTVIQARALLDFLQDVVPLMQETPADPTAPLVCYVP